MTRIFNRMTRDERHDSRSERVSTSPCEDGTAGPIAVDQRADFLEGVVPLQPLGQCRSLSQPHFECQPAARTQETWCVLDQAHQDGDSERAAVESQPWFVMGDLGSHLLDPGSAD